MQFFSQRKGLTPVRTIIQRDSMDDALRNGLWNAIYITFLEGQSSSAELSKIAIRWWIQHFKERIDKLPLGQEIGYFRDRLFACHWFEVYDLIECIVHFSDNKNMTDKFIEVANFILERELSAYRI